jgi:NAD(P)-dependent dehydrogenase (short-subunit alcohol dehydrogenase family)
MLNNLTKTERGLNIAIAGSSGGIGAGFIKQLTRSGAPIDHLFSLSRTQPASMPINGQWLRLDLEDEATVEKAATAIEEVAGQLDLIVLATGILHDKELQPEKDWSQLDPEKLSKLFAINTIGPAIFIKHFLPLLPRDGSGILAALSARVGSISDNQIGGWYGYRSSKAALNQLIRTASIELARKRKQAAIVGLHPGTVETDLSAPFRNNRYKRFSPEESAGYLLQVLGSLDRDASGKVFDWQGEIVPE